MNLNKVFIIGRLTADPQVRTTPSGQSVSSFSVATNRVWKDNTGARREDTEFHNIVCWGRQAEIVRQFVAKGSMIMIEGRLQTRVWQDNQNQSRRTTEIICERLQLGPRAANAGAGSSSNFADKSGFDNSSSGENNSYPSGSNDNSNSSNVPTIELDSDDQKIKDEDLPF